MKKKAGMRACWAFFWKGSNVHKLMSIGSMGRLAVSIYPASVLVDWCRGPLDSNMKPRKLSIGHRLHMMDSPTHTDIHTRTGAHATAKASTLHSVRQPWPKKQEVAGEGADRAITMSSKIRFNVSTPNTLHALMHPRDVTCVGRPCALQHNPHPSPPPRFAPVCIIKVCFVSGEDPDFPASELDVHS